MRDYSYQFEGIVIGHSFEAVYDAFKRKVPILLNSKQRPFRFDKLKKRLIIEEIDLDTENVLEAWSSILLQHAIDGLVPFGTAIEKLTIEGSEILISLGGRFRVRTSFRDCLVFEDDNLVLENQQPQNIENLYRVFDWFKVRSGLKHEFKFLQDKKERLVNKVYFYKSERIDGNKDLKDCVSESQLYESELADFEYSPTMARFKTEDMMEKNGIKGTKNGVDKSGIQKFLSLKLEPHKRSKYKKTYNKYVKTKNIRFAKKLNYEEV